MFYYSRAARTRELSRQMYPDTPQPDQHFLGRDFETCVLQVTNLQYLLILLIYVDITSIYTCLTVEDECMHTAG